MIHILNNKVRLSLLMLGSLATLTTNTNTVKLLAVKDAAIKVATPAAKTVIEKAKDLFTSTAGSASKYLDEFAKWATPIINDGSKQITQAWKAGQATLSEKTVDIIKNEKSEFNKKFPKYLRDAFYGAAASAIAGYVITKGVEYLLAKPLEATKNKLNYAKKVFYVAQAQELLKDENILEKIVEKVFQAGLTLSIPEQIAVLGLYLMDNDQDLTTKQLLEEETVDKIVSGEISLDKSQLKKLITSIIKQNKQAENDQEAEDKDPENKAIAEKTTNKNVASEEKHDVKNTAPAAS